MPNDGLRLIQSFDQAIDILGGPSKAAKKLKRTPQQVCQWRKRHGTIPAELFPRADKAFKALGYVAPARVFRFEFD
jgi:DNA-binding transcriptional regulator YdaS (Cro superfamily)